MSFVASIRSTAHRLFAPFLVFLIIAMIVGWGVITLFPTKEVIDTTYEGVHIVFSANRTIAIWPNNCVTLHWQIDNSPNVKAVFLNNSPQPATASGPLCAEVQSPEQSAMRIVFADGTQPIYALNLYYANAAFIVFALLVGCLALIPPFSTRGWSMLPFALRRLVALKGLIVLIALQAALIVGALARIHWAFYTPLIVDWDEAYYANIAVMGAHGLGLYPSMQNMLPTHLMGGTGFLVGFYVWAVQIFGPTIYSLRLVSLLAGGVALIAIFLTVKIWYGSAAALVATSLTPVLALFAQTNTARMDTITIAAVAWGLFFVAYAWQKKGLRWHIIAGLAFGLALQAHLHTIATGFACGLLYVYCYIRTAWQTKRLSLRSPLTAFVVGLAIGVGIYIVCNILPNVDNYFAVTGSARSLGQRALAGSLMDTFLQPGVMITKELTRYTDLMQHASTLEFDLFALGLLALVVRHTETDIKVLILAVGAIIGGAFIFNGTSRLYASHIFPTIILPIAPLLTHGFARKGLVRWRAFSPVAVVLTLGLLYMFVSPVLPAAQNLPMAPANAYRPSDIATRLKAIVSPQCQIAGDRTLYVPYFMDYPRFNSTNDIEVQLGTAYLHQLNELGMWYVIQPDVVFGEIGRDMQTYMQETHYKNVAPDIWVKTESALTVGCVVKPLAGQ